jgi:membrane protease YdiL (CAAX protease family)
MRLGDNWKLITLQVTLGPVLEEIVFRGYLFAFLIWLLSKGVNDAGRGPSVMVLTAVVFAVVHLAQPGVSWLQLACITSTGTLNGNPLRLDQVALWVDRSRGRFTCGLQPGPLCDLRCRVAW